MARRRVTAVGFLGLFVGSLTLSCAGSSTDPWHIPKGREGRFREANRICHQLTDKDQGLVDREKFDKCMGQRGWRRTRWTDRFILGI